MNRLTLLAVLGCALLLAPGLAEGKQPPINTDADADTDANAPSPAPYPLDDVPRQVPVEQKLPCERGDLPTVKYQGTHVRYHKAVRVHPAFRERLERFEQIALETAEAVYGRAPRRLVHIGTLNCRRMRRYPDWMSEHALGNGLDLAGFDFGPLPRGQSAPDGLPRALRRGFSVRVVKHWKGKGAVAGVHGVFLRALGAELARHEEIFRTLLGPDWPGHGNHFHFDAAPYRVVGGLGRPQD